MYTMFTTIGAYVRECGVDGVGGGVGCGCCEWAHSLYKPIKLLISSILSGYTEGGVSVACVFGVALTTPYHSAQVFIGLIAQYVVWVWG